MQKHNQDISFKLIYLPLTEYNVWGIGGLMFLLLVALDLVYLLWLCMALFDLWENWVLIFPALDELSVIVLNFIFSFKMSCYGCVEGKKAAGSGNYSGLREAFYKCLQEWFEHRELQLSHVFSVPEGGAVQWSILLWWGFLSTQAVSVSVGGACLGFGAPRLEFLLPLQAWQNHGWEQLSANPETQLWRES